MNFAQNTPSTFLLITFFAQTLTRCTIEFFIEFCTKKTILWISLNFCELGQNFYWTSWCQIIVIMVSVICVNINSGTIFMIPWILYIPLALFHTTFHYLLCCHKFSFTRLALMNDLNLIDPTLSQSSETALANILFYGDSKKSTSENGKILQSTIKYIIVTKHFDESLFYRSHLYARFRLYTYIWHLVYICDICIYIYIYMWHIYIYIYIYIYDIL